MPVGMDLVTNTMIFYGGGVLSSTDVQSVNSDRAMAMAYVWGRQDAGESEQDTGYSQTFADIWALARLIGHGGALSGSFNEWRATDRIVVRVPEHGRFVAVGGRETNGTTIVEARPIPWASDWNRYWG